MAGRFQKIRGNAQCRSILVKIPLSTYRIEFNPSFGFKETKKIELTPVGNILRYFSVAVAQTDKEN